ncbi:MAG: AIR synthase-related protein, partial [Acidimicrobiia bacterium]
VMWQFAEVVDGMSDACRAHEIPVVGGNVSFYNESRGRDIDPTPVVGLVGVIDGLTTVPPGPRVHDGDALVLLGATAPELGGSEWATAHGLRAGRPPVADLPAAVALHVLVRALVNDRVVSGVHDCSEGGLAVALAEMAIEGECGVHVALSATFAPALLWFSESAARVVVSVEPARLDDVLGDAATAGVPAAHLGRAGGDRIVADGAFSVSVSDATVAWREAIPRALGRESASSGAG